MYYIVWTTIDALQAQLLTCTHILKPHSMKQKTGNVQRETAAIFCPYHLELLEGAPEELNITCTNGRLVHLHSLLKVSLIAEQSKCITCGGEGRKGDLSLTSKCYSHNMMLIQRTP